MSRAQALELESRGDDLKTAGYVLVGVGGAALAAAATLLVLDAQSAQEVSFGAGPVEGGAGAFVGGTF
jgi:shikimate 5-dehydrogenase